MDKENINAQFDTNTFREFLRKVFVFELMPSKMPLLCKKTFEDDHYRIDVNICFERRKSFRINIPSNINPRIILRTPMIKQSHDLEKFLDWALNWLNSLIQKSPHTIEKFRKIAHIPNYFFVKTVFKDYTIDIIHRNVRTAKSQLIGGNIVEVSLPNEIEHASAEKTVRVLFNKTIAVDLLNDMKHFVSAVNKETFNIHYDDVLLSYTHSKWGSCSHVGNLQFSSKLLLAPENVVRHVIIHELAHRIEFNHSVNFWNLVQKFDPDYLKIKKLLRQNAHIFDISFN
ncbi:MAG: M48 family metallopeptidase [Saprospiraceae bacterium]|nr:M48 family metallopeptidase [Saprospiraceae bacterium]